jgi:hypothetical protein
MPSLKSIGQTVLTIFAVLWAFKLLKDKVPVVASFIP